MTLKNLLGISLAIPPDAAAIGKLLAAGQTAIQTLDTSVGLAPPEAIVLDALRMQRDLSDYSGDLVPDVVVAECLVSAEALPTHPLGVVERASA